MLKQKAFLQFHVKSKDSEKKLDNGRGQGVDLQSLFPTPAVSRQIFIAAKY